MNQCKPCKNLRSHDSQGPICPRVSRGHLGSWAKPVCATILVAVLSKEAKK